VIAIVNFPAKVRMAIGLVIVIVILGGSCQSYKQEHTPGEERVDTQVQTSDRH